MTELYVPDFPQGIIWIVVPNSCRVIHMLREIASTFRRVGMAVLLLSGSVILSAFMVVCGKVMDWLILVALDEGGSFHSTADVAVDASFTSAAIVVAACGAVLVATEAVKSTVVFIRSG